MWLAELESTEGVCAAAGHLLLLLLPLLLAVVLLPLAAAAARSLIQRSYARYAEVP
jgi:hypothetical protein